MFTQLFTLNNEKGVYFFSMKRNTSLYIQGVQLILVQTLRGGRGHEDKHY